MTPSGRFDTNTKICLSFSAFHPELWQPAWGIRLILEALIAFLPSPADGAIGALDWTPEERKRLAKKSVQFCCHRCGKTADLLPKLSDGEKLKKGVSSRFEKEIEQLKLAQIANETKNTATIEKRKDLDVPAPTTELEVAPSEVPNSDLVEGEPELGEEQIATTAPAPVTEDAGIEDEDITLEAANPYEFDISWLTDPMLNLSIVLMALICFLLTRKAHALLVELQTLNHSLNMRPL